MQACECRFTGSKYNTSNSTGTLIKICIVLSITFHIFCWHIMPQICAHKHRMLVMKPAQRYLFLHSRQTFHISRLNTISQPVVLLKLESLKPIETMDERIEHVLILIAAVSFFCLFCKLHCMFCKLRSA